MDGNKLFNVVLLYGDIYNGGNGEHILFAKAINELKGTIS